MNAGRKREAIEQTVTDYFAAFQTMDPDLWASAFAEDGVAHDPVGAPPVRGREALRRFFQEEVCAAFSQLEVTADQTFPAGDEVAIKWTARGTTTAGKPVTFEGIEVFEMDSAGKIRTAKAYWDPELLTPQMEA